MQPKLLSHEDMKWEQNHSRVTVRVPHQQYQDLVQKQKVSPLGMHNQQHNAMNAVQAAKA